MSARLAIRREVLTALDAYFTGREKPASFMRYWLPRLAVFRHEAEPHRVTLYGPGPTWRTHAHYVGPLAEGGHCLVPIERSVEYPQALATTPEEEESRYAKRLKLASGRPFLSMRQLDYLWTAAEKLGVSELDVFHLLHDLYPDTAIAKLNRTQYDGLLGAVTHLSRQRWRAAHPEEATRYRADLFTYLDRL